MAEVQRDEPLAVLEDGTEVLGALPASTEGGEFNFAERIAASRRRNKIAEKIGINYEQEIAALEARCGIAEKLEGIEPTGVLHAHPDPFGTAIDIEAA